MTEILRAIDEHRLDALTGPASAALIKDLDAVGLGVIAYALRHHQPRPVVPGPGVGPESTSSTPSQVETEARTRRLAMLTRLLVLGADPTVTGSVTRPPMPPVVYAAVELRCPETIALLHDQSMEAKKNPMTPIQSGHARPESVVRVAGGHAQLLAHVHGRYPDPEDDAWRRQTLLWAIYCPETFAKSTTSGRRGWTALHHATEAADCTLVTWLLDAGADVNAQTTIARGIRGPRPRDGLTPLALALRSNRALVDLLLDRGAELRDPPRQTLLQAAAMQDDPAIVERLLAVHPEWLEQPGLLHLAAKYARRSVVRLFLDRGVSPTSATIPRPSGAGWEDLMEGVPRFFAEDLAATFDVFKVLVPLGTAPDVELYTYEGESESLLGAALRTGDMDFAHMLLRHGADPNYVVEGKSTLERLLPTAPRSVIELLLQHGGDLEKVTTTRHTLAPVHALVAANRWEMLQLLLDGGRLRTMYTLDYSFSLFAHACASGCEETARFLWAERHRLEVPDADHNGGNAYDLVNAGSLRAGRTPLHLAAHKGHVRIVRWLLTIGADPSIVSRIGQTPLHVACEAGHAGLVELLLSCPRGRHALGHPWPPTNNTPLHTAAERGHAEVVEVLLDHGAHSNARNWKRSIPVFLACPGDHADVVRVFLDRGLVDLETRDSDDHTLLMAAARHQKGAVVELLLSRGASPAQAGPGGLTALHTAALNGATQTTQALLAYGADPNVCTPEGITPLHLAVERQGSEASIEVLLAHGADVHARTSPGRTAIEKTKKTELQMSLIRAGANLAELLTSLPEPAE